MKKLVVNQNACIGCGACVAIDSEHFAFNEEGLSNAISEENLESKNVVEAIDACPTSAIHMEEDCGCQHDEACTCGDDCTCDCTDECGCEHCECEK